LKGAEPAPGGPEIQNANGDFHHDCEEKRQDSAVTDLISVIISIYNRPDALDAVLRGLSRQSDRNFEVIASDDGSPPSTAVVVESWKDRLGVPLSHVWHEHDGFRAPEISNRAILKSRGSYCIFLDGDCIPRPGFVAAHRRLAEPGWFVFGNRILMLDALTRACLQNGVEPETWTLAAFLQRRRDVNRLTPLIRLPLGPLRKLDTRSWESVRTCNLAVWRTDLERVNGQEGLFVGWGPHDSDLAVRLIRSGCRRKDGRFATGVLHLAHPDADRARMKENRLLFDQTLASDRVRAVRGLAEVQADAARG
jgi:glycosyltransferase involved in cell wall biosynthesis